MRTIKFRGLTDTGRWMYGFLIKEENKSYIIDSVVECDNDCIIIEKCRQVIPETVGQFTGEEHRKGADVYEGDLVWSAGHTYIVEFHDGCFCCVVEGEGDYRKHLLWEILSKHNSEVIGNIHYK
jgi:hypothetical protein